MGAHHHSSGARFPWGLGASWNPRLWGSLPQPQGLVPLGSGGLLDTPPVGLVSTALGPGSLEVWGPPGPPTCGAHHHSSGTLLPWGLGASWTPHPWGLVTTALGSCSPGVWGPPRPPACGAHHHSSGARFPWGPEDAFPQCCAQHPVIVQAWGVLPWQCAHESSGVGEASVGSGEGQPSTRAHPPPA